MYLYVGAFQTTVEVSYKIFSEHLVKSVCVKWKLGEIIFDFIIFEQTIAVNLVTSSMTRGDRLFLELHHHTHFLFLMLNDAIHVPTSEFYIATILKWSEVGI